MNQELPDVQAGFRKGRGTRYQIANICWIVEKAREFQKNIYFCFIDYAKAFDCVDHNKLGKFLKRWEYQTTFSASWETCMWVKKQQNQTWNWTGSKLGKEYVKVVCHCANFTYMQSTLCTYMQSTSCEMPGGMKCKLESRLSGEISITSDMQMKPFWWQKEGGIKEPLDEGEKGE